MFLIVTVNASQSPFLHTFYHRHPLFLTIDTRAETNIVRVSLAKHISAKITKGTQADGRTLLSVVGETCLLLICPGIALTLEALVVEDLDIDKLACVNIAVWPGEVFEIHSPPELLTDSALAIEPHTDSLSSSHLKPTHV